MSNEIVNRVEKSNLVQIDLDSIYPEGERVIFDIKNLLHEESIVIEKECREYVKNCDWSVYKDKYVCITCSVEAIVPLWTYMLVASKIKPVAKKVIMGNFEDLEKSIFTDLIHSFDFSQYTDKSVIIKGCGNKPIPESVFIDFYNKVQEHAKSIMFGEACSAVPLFKK